MADFLGTAVGSIVIPALVFAVGLTFKKDNLTIAKVFIISAVCWTITTIVVDQFNPIMTYQEKSVTLDDGMTKDYGHGVTAPDPTMINVALRNSDGGGKVIDVAANSIRTGFKLLLVIAMLITLANISTKPNKRSKVPRNKTKSKPSKNRSKPEDDLDDGL